MIPLFSARCCQKAESVKAGLQVGDAQQLSRGAPEMLALYGCKTSETPEPFRGLILTFCSFLQ